MSEDKRNYSVIGYSEHGYVGATAKPNQYGHAHEVTKPGRLYTRGRARRILSELRNDYYIQRGELYLDGTLICYWSKETDWRTHHVWNGPPEHLRIYETGQARVICQAGIKEFIVEFKGRLFRVTRPQYGYYAPFNVDYYGPAF